MMRNRRFRQWRRSLMRRISLFPLGIIFVTLVLIGVSVLGGDDSIDSEIDDAMVPTLSVVDKFRFILLGDTGGLPLMHETRAQKKVAKKLIELSKNEGFEAVVTLGDNIYYTGVDNELDGRFESSFERPYKHPFLEKKRFYMIAGNHDHFGNISAQIAYTKYSKKWFYPSLYYNFTLITKDGAKVDFVMIDTIILCGNTKDIEFAGFWKMMFSKSTEPNGPTNDTAAELQWKWIEEQLKSSTAPYLFIIGHYPIHSVSSHGPIQCMKRLTPLLEAYNATAYISGHDHTLQHITYPSSINGRLMHYVVSGAGSRSDPSTKHWDTVQRPGSVKFHWPSSGTFIRQLGMSDGAFIVTEVDAKQTVLRFFDSKGSQLYTTSFDPR